MDTNYFENNSDVARKFITKDYLIENYADLFPNIKMPSIWSFGDNSSGQLGDNSISPKSSPVQTVAGSTNWKQISCGGNHFTSIKIDGSLWCCGRNLEGQLGDNTVISKSSPVQTVSGGTDWKQIANGQNYSTAIKTDGTLWFWGYNAYGQLGDNTVVHKSSPVQTVAGGTNWKQVACGFNHSAAIKTDGTLWLCGNNSYGQLGDNTIIQKSSPVQTVAGGTNWKQVACGAYHTIALKTDGTLWSWGYNFYGSLGNGQITDISSPIQTVAGGNNWKQVTCGGYHTSVIKTDGTLWTWGFNQYGQLGDNSILNKQSPVQTVTDGTNWKQIVNGLYFTFALKTDGSLWSFGQGTSGQLGDNTSVSKSSPVQTVTGGTNWKQVSCGANYTIVISDLEGI